MPKIRIRPNYAAENRERNHVERTEHIEKRQQEEGFFESMAGDIVHVHLTSGKEMEGVLSASTYNRYDIMVENEGGLFLVPKASIEYVRTIPDKMR